MKKLLMIIVAICGFASVASAQCGDELMKAALAAMGNCQYIKDFDIKLAPGSADGVKFSVVLNSRTKYQVNVANGATNSENVVIEVFDNEGRLLGTNSSGDKVYAVFQILCSKTGAYKLHVYAKSKGEACARAVLSLVEQLSE